MRIIFYDKNNNKIFDIINIDDTIDISFKEDRIYIYGQGHHYSEFFYNKTIVDTSLINMSSLTDSEIFIIKKLEERFDFEYITDEDFYKISDNKNKSINEELGILGN